MLKIVKGVAGGLLGFAILGALPAQAQTPYENVQGSSFDLWCQEHMKLPASRCDHRTPEDEKAYEAYRDKIDSYEEKLRLEQQRQGEIDRTILHNDPVDNPAGQNPATP